MDNMIHELLLPPLPKASTPKLHMLGSISNKLAIKTVVSFNANTAFTWTSGLSLLL
jgi:hypothetical protein